MKSNRNHYVGIVFVSPITAKANRFFSKYPGMAMIMAMAAMYLFLAGCASTPKLHPTVASYYDTVTMAPKWDTQTIAPHLDSAFTQNWQQALQIAQYDYYAWVATDSAIQYQDSLLALGFTSLLVHEQQDTTTVHFLKRAHGEQIESLYRVHFVNRKPLGASFSSQIIPIAHPLTQQFHLLENAYARTQSKMDAMELPYNNYLYTRGDTLNIYFLPAVSEQKQRIVAAGAFVVTYVKGEFMESQSLHKGVANLEALQSSKFIFWGSTLSVIPNVADIAQFLIQRYRAPIAFIGTSEFTFLLQWQAKTNTVFVNALPKGASKAALEALIVGIP
jgi:hypothetical protein